MPRRRGFTLVEMMVAVALVLLMMLMFASIFQNATKTMAQQKGMAENDGKARTLTIIMKGDLDRRTFRNVRPYYPGEDSLTSPHSFANREGYLYISENDLENNLDDVIQFTIATSDDELAFTGRTRLLGAVTDLNQPEADDGQVQFNPSDPTDAMFGTVEITRDTSGATNRTGASRWAEVAWFVRNGTLYRRTLLLRDPQDSTATEQPAAGLIDSRYRSTGMSPPNPAGAPVASFWQDFDYSAHFHAPDSRVSFNGATSRIVPGVGEFSIARPQNRFGFDHFSGLPREYGTPLTATDFIGRFTHRETSDPMFGYPSQLRDFDSDGNDDNSPLQPAIPLGVVDGQVHYAQGGDGVWGGTDDSAFNGPRRNEDAMLHNVHSFDIKVWDDGLRRFVDLGHNIAGGIFRADDPATGSINEEERQNVYFGPRSLPAAGSDPITLPTAPTINRVYDTWHPGLGDMDGDLTPDRPPFEPRPFTSPYRTTTVDEWQASTGYAAGTIIRRPGTTVFSDIVYRAQNGGTSNSAPPASWPNSVGATVSDNGILWQAVDNSVMSLKAIQITIRYHDVSSDQLRQMSFVYALTP